MADMTKIVAATIAIAVRDFGRDVQIGKCDRGCNSSCSDHRGVHRRECCTRRVFSSAWRSHDHDNRWNPHGRSQAGFFKELSLLQNHRGASDIGRL